MDDIQLEPRAPNQPCHCVSSTTGKGDKKFPEPAAGIAAAPLDPSKQCPSGGGEPGRRPQRDLCSESSASRCAGSGLLLLLLLLLLWLLCRQRSVLPSHGCAAGWARCVGPAKLHRPPSRLVLLILSSGHHQFPAPGLGCVHGLCAQGPCCSQRCGSQRARQHRQRCWFEIHLHPPRQKPDPPHQTRTRRSRLCCRTIAKPAGHP